MPELYPKKGAMDRAMSFLPSIRKINYVKVFCKKCHLFLQEIPLFHNESMETLFKRQYIGWPFALDVQFVCKSVLACRYVLQI